MAPWSNFFHRSWLCLPCFLLGDTLDTFDIIWLVRSEWLMTHPTSQCFHVNLPSWRVASTFLTIRLTISQHLPGFWVSDHDPANFACFTSRKLRHLQPVIEDPFRHLLVGRDAELAQLRTGHACLIRISKENMGMGFMGIYGDFTKIWGGNSETCA